MIIFSGYISGDAEKRFIAKNRNILIFAFGQGLVFILPLWFGFTAPGNPTFALLSYIFGVAIIITLILFLTKSKKENKKIKPKKIYTDGQYITAISDSNVETKQVKEVKSVIDHGEFYELTFPFGKMSNVFVCQKDLLTQGTLKDFEALFKDKIVKKAK